MPGNSGNARDNRQRGNAAQLLEKYKNMARDAQLAGDRVQTEYYLQFADHYFRVLEENRSRFEDQAPRRRRDEEMDEDGDDQNDIDADGTDEGEDERPQRKARRERSDRGDRPERAERPQRRERANGHARDGDDDHGETIPMDVLPPSIGANDDDDREEEERPRRRTRRPRAVEGDATEA